MGLNQLLSIFHKLYRGEQYQKLNLDQKILLEHSRHHRLATSTSYVDT